MATLAAVLASTHHPFYLKATTAPPEQQMPQAPEWKRKVEAYRETLTRAKPDILVMVGADHFHQFFLDNYPTFLIGKARRYDATFYNEEREFGLPKYVLEGDEDLSGYMLQGLLDREFDFAFSNELKIDHSIICPIITVRPQADLPVVPIYANIFAPPLPSPKRFYKLGRAIREIIDSYPSDKRIAAIGTGHLSLELGGPRQFGEHGPDPEFDRQAIEWLANGDIEAILANVTHESLAKAGNATAGFMDMILMLGIAGPEKAAYVDNLDLFHTMEAYFTWYPEGAAA
ncbi:extradiol ring-cleavage dioxygenase [Rhodoplanes sp. TEM]|uniref:Extradiol ring-cleavage dioxygenase n=1 Tax=Rhodoplanes tepidamans TaxID=200616 RepID=A0ABT5J545_RHOTP|nr:MULTISPECIES: extradiol ring-cleavage dioxygenase [Rhodoplanes]MDC7784521.1 extradiol ring-cleavage dioxygenase [Rhodoplanes tepidamans]MDC7984428.1 extradiol ring-cleavage dioxygenase [Rhodoplanes sp. TEM]MDQ0355749.1 protocatechuate 4,5-dioxygenase beta chain [Rhodoplanes tepidamans]